MKAGKILEKKKSRKILESRKILDKKKSRKLLDRRKRRWWQGSKEGWENGGGKRMENNEGKWRLQVKKKKNSVVSTETV